MKKIPTKKQSLHVKVGDLVQVISGQNKGKTGVVLSLIKETSKVTVKGVNIKIKHFKPSGPGKTGRIEELEFPIHSSNVSLYED